MMCPVRCFTCGKVVADKYYEYREGLQRAKELGHDNAAGKLLDELGFDRYCCRRMLLSQEELIDEIIHYPRF